MRIWYRNPRSSTDFIAGGASYSLQLSIENDIGDALAFWSPIGHVRMGARILAESDSGEVLFLGIVISTEYSGTGGLHRYDAVACEALLPYRYAPDIVYPGGGDIALSDIFSSDAPPQAAGTNQYCMGLLWLWKSKIPEGLVSWSAAGVGTLEGWDAITAGRDIYLDGRLLTEVAYGSLTAGTHRCARQWGNLYVYGAGTGDTYGVIAADGYSEGFVRLGTIATDSDVEGLYDTDGAQIWPLIRDLVEETGQYVVFRRTEDCVYLDISATPKSRGSEDSPRARLKISDDFGLKKRMVAKYNPASCVLGLGSGPDNAEGVRYGYGSATPVGEAWMEETYELADARLSPWGNLGGATEDFFDAINQHAPISVDLYREDLRPGDCCEIDLGGGDVFTTQLRSITMYTSGPSSATFGAPELSILTARLEREETDAIEGYRDLPHSDVSDTVELTASSLQNLHDGGSNQGISYHDGILYILWGASLNCVQKYDTDLNHVGFIDLDDENYDDSRIDLYVDSSNIYIAGNPHCFKYSIDGSYIDDIDVTCGAGNGMPEFPGQGATGDSAYVYFIDNFESYHGSSGGSEWWWYGYACIIRRLKSDFSSAGTFQRFTHPYYGESNGAIDTDGSHIYSTWKRFYNTGGGGDFTPTDWAIHKLDNATFSSATQRTGLDVGVSLHGLACLGDHVYIIRSDDSVLKILKSDLSTVTSYSDISAISICSDGTYLYTIDSDGNLNKYNSSMSLISSAEIVLEKYTLYPAATFTFASTDFSEVPDHVFLSLETDSTESPENPDARVDVFVVVNGYEVALLRGQKWGEILISEIDITDYLYLDGSDENVLIYAKWNYFIEETLSITATAKGVMS